MKNSQNTEHDGSSGIQSDIPKQCEGDNADVLYERENRWQCGLLLSCSLGLHTLGGSLRPSTLGILGSLRTFPLLRPSHITRYASSTLVRNTGNIRNGQPRPLHRNKLARALCIDIRSTTRKSGDHVKSLESLFCQSWCDGGWCIGWCGFGQLFVLYTADRFVGRFNRRFGFRCTCSVLCSEKAVHVGLEIALQWLFLYRRRW